MSDLIAHPTQTIPFDDYRSIPAINPSTLVHGFKSMLSLKRAIDGDKPEETAAMRFGQQYHGLILEPERFADECVICPDFSKEPGNVIASGKDKGKQTTSANTKYVKERKAEFAYKHAGKSVVDAAYHRRMLLMLQSLWTHDRIRDIIQNSDKEQTVTGKICHTESKGRLDLLGEAIVDLKGTSDARPMIFGATACRLHYPEKLAFYRELIRQKTGEKLPVYIIVAETDGDFDRCLVPLPEPVLDHAFGRISRVMLQYENAVKMNHWPGVDGGAETVDFYVPNYWMPSDEEMDWS